MMINIELNKPLYRTCICSDKAMMAHENLMMEYIKRFIQSKIYSILFNFLPTKDTQRNQKESSEF